MRKQKRAEKTESQKKKRREKRQGEREKSRRQIYSSVCLCLSVCVWGSFLFEMERSIKYGGFIQSLALNMRRKMKRNTHVYICFYKKFQEILWGDTWSQRKEEEEKLHRDRQAFTSHIRSSRLIDSVLCVSVCK